MRAKVFAFLSVTVLVTAAPQPARFDQRQTGTYNLHLNLKDGQVYAVVKDVLVSAPVRQFAVTLKGPIASPTTESPRTDVRTGIIYPQPPKLVVSPPVKTKDAFSANLNTPTGVNIKTSNAETSAKPPTVEIYPNLKAPTELPSTRTPNDEVSPGVATSQSNGNSNNRRQNNKVASQIVNQQPAELVAPPPPPPPSPIQAAKPTLSPLPALPSSIIAALTDQRSTNQRIETMPDEVNEIDRIKTSYTLS